QGHLRGGQPRRARVRGELERGQPGDERKVVWATLDARLQFLEDEREWVGTEIEFEIDERDGRTELRFTHHGLSPSRPGGSPTGPTPRCSGRARSARTSAAGASTSRTPAAASSRPSPPAT